MAGERIDCPECHADITIPFPTAPAKKIVIHKHKQRTMRPSDYKKPLKGASSRSSSRPKKAQPEENKGPGYAGWACLGLSCVFLFVPFVGVYIAAALGFAAFVLSIVMMATGKAGPGIALLLCSLIVPPIVAVIASLCGLALLAGMATTL